MGCLEDVFGMYMVYIHVYRGGDIGVTIIITMVFV